MARSLHERRVAGHLSKLGDRSPIFVLGTQKSGTTVIAASLAHVSGTSATIDIRRAIAYPEWKILLQYGIGSFENYLFRFRKEMSRGIIKEPGLTFFYPELREYFPLARFVMIQRHPYEVIRSTLDRLQIPGNIPEINVRDHSHLAQSPAWRINLDTSWLGHCPRNHVDALAFRWKLAARIYLKNPNEFLLVKYEDFLEDKVRVIRRLARDLGLARVQDIGQKVSEQFQNQGTRPASWTQYFGPNLDLVKSVCSKEAGDLGYDLNLT
jgi:hypothetical protein